MAAILTAAEMRALEQAAIASGEVTGLELMERAGRGVVEAILAEWPAFLKKPYNALVLCGPGNNGGDGFVVARLLKERGWIVTVYLYGDPEKLPPDAKANFLRWRSLGPVSSLETFEAHGRGWREDLVVDALFGIGLTRGIASEHPQMILADLAEAADHSNGIFPRAHDVGYPVVVALDVPSGLCADSGRFFGPRDGQQCHPVATANLTVTFHALKLGHVLSGGPENCGNVRVVDIGLKELSLPRLTQLVELPFPWVLSKRTGHKYAHGHALLLSGGCGRGGAARLAARGALRIGAGLVTLAVPPAALQENAARLDAVMLRSVRDAEPLADLLSDPRYNSLAAGPGLGLGDREADLLHALLDASRGAGEAKPRAVILDADALTLLAKTPELRAKLHDRCILTPHDGEFARLFPAIAERWHAPATTGPAFSKLDAARDAARDCGAVVLLKGPDTVIADPSGRAAISAAVYDRAAPWLATAGSGDVLSGFIAGLLARGLAPFDAACTASWLHVECARSFGPCLTAEDLPDELPKVFRALKL